MKNQKSCCDFFRNLLCKKSKAKPNPEKNQRGSKPYQENIEVTLSSKTASKESKSRIQKVQEPSRGEISLENNSIFYDKNSALVEIVDQDKAIDNLDVAFGIINNSHGSMSERSAEKSSRDKFSMVIKGINFKQILESDESIVISDRSSI